MGCFRLGLTTLALSCVGPSFAQTKPTPAQITLESFAAPPFIEDLELSPNGQYYAARLTLNGKQLMAIVSIYDLAEKPVFLNIDNAKTAVDGWNWVNDDWLLLYLSTTTGVEGDKWRISRVASMNRKTSKIVELGWKDAAQNAADVVWIARDGSPRILLGIQNSIYSNFEEFWPQISEFDVSTGKAKLNTRRRTSISSYVADSAGTVRIGYGYEPLNRTQKMIYRSDSKETFKVADRANLAKEEDLISPALLLAAPDKAVTIDNPDGRFALYALDLTTMQRGEKIYGHDTHDIGGIIASPSGDAVAGIGVIEDRPRTIWIDPGMKETQAALDAAVGVGNAKIVSWDRSMQKLVVRVGGPDQAGSYYLYDRASGGKMSRLAYADENLKMRKLARVSTITYKARDGLNISAVLTLPNSGPTKNLPLILLPHGGPAARDYETWDWMTQYFAWRGYAVIQPNYRGSTGFGEAHYKKGEGEWGLKMQDDLNDAVTHLAAQALVDPKRVCIVGASYGGYAAMRGAQRDGGLYRCAISYAGVSDLPRMMRYDGRFLYGNEYKASIRKSAPDLTSVSPLRLASQFSTPILLMHGKVDLRVPVEQSREMAERLKAAGKTYRYVEQPLGDHHFSRREDRLQFLQEVDAFLSKYNPAEKGSQ